MAIYESNREQWQNRIVSALPPALRTIVQGNSRRDLLKKVDATLLVFDNRVIDLESGETRVLHQAEEESGSNRVTGNRASADQIAVACKSLLGEDHKERALLLLLPPTEFVATTQAMPGVTRENLVSALRLQTETLLPSYEGSLSLAISSAAMDRDDDRVALWIADASLSHYFDAFADKELFLAAVMPRNLLAISTSSSGQLIDQDAQAATRILQRQGVLLRWLHVNNIDFQQDEFVAQWEKGEQEAVGLETQTMASEADYLALAQANKGNDYCFFPQGALDARKKVEKGKKAVFAAAAAVVLMFLMSVPFIGQSLEFRSMAARLESQRSLSIDARRDQAVVVNFESEWGPLNDFPEQRLREAMFTLQNILSPDALSSMEVTDGLIKIQGSSAEPQSILQRLEQDPLFTEVIFSRATNNSRYYIDLRLSTVNFDGYMVRYFPDD
jgi:hypothetical protein